MNKKGFYTALGTPLDENGKIIEGALRAHINQQINAGASGLLLLGSMGIQSCIRHSEYGRAVDIAVSEVSGRVPLFVGAMDNSVARVKERLEMIGEGRRIDGIVVTVPFYARVNEGEAIYFLRAVADASPYPIYIYDLPSVTQFKINMKVIDGVIDHPNVSGMKSPDWELIKAIARKYPEAGFECLYSGLDSFDYANALGIDKNLDGMFCCTPKNARAMYDAVDAGDLALARHHLDNILLLRDTMLRCGLMRCFTYCMSLLGFEGNFYQDFMPPTAPDAIDIMRDTMKTIGEL